MHALGMLPAFFLLHAHFLGVTLIPESQEAEAKTFLTLTHTHVFGCIERKTTFRTGKA